MKDLRGAFEEADLLAEDATRRARDRSQRIVESLVLGEAFREHCFDPWVIARVLPRSHQIASTSLKRAGFEAWFPTGRRFRLLPKRFYAPEKRHLRRVVLREDLSMPYGSYIFLRRVFGHQSLWRLFELTGVLGVCAFGEEIARVPDFEVEILRMWEYDGRFDCCDAVISAKQFQLADVVRSHAAQQRSNSAAVAFKVLDADGEAVHFIEQFGRITRVATATGDMSLPT